MGGTQGPTIVSSSNLTDFATTLGTPAAAQSFIVSGTTLTNDISIAFNDQNNFEMKLSSESTWSKTLTIPQVAGIVNNSKYSLQSSYSRHHTALLLHCQALEPQAKPYNVNGSASIPFDPKCKIAIFPGSVDNLLQFPATTVSKTRTKVLNIKTTDILSALSVNITGTNAANVRCFYCYNYK